MTIEVDRIVAEIDTMDLDALRSFWRGRYGTPPPLRSVTLMRLQLAWRVQADALGGIDTVTRRVLARSGPTEPEGMRLGIGAVLTRTWKGRKVEVVVEAQGFRLNGQRFASLSAAATAIAGSRWNGPRFFGLRDPA